MIGDMKEFLISSIDGLLQIKVDAVGHSARQNGICLDPDEGTSRPQRNLLGPDGSPDGSVYKLSDSSLNVNTMT